MAISELWQIPSPSSSFLEGVAFKILPKRTCSLSFKFEGANGDWESLELRFHEVVALKCTYLPALTVQMIQSAYDKLVDVGDSSWLAEARAVHRQANEGAPLRHLRISFDDGPCYEFLCTGFEAISGT